MRRSRGPSRDWDAYHAAARFRHYDRDRWTRYYDDDDRRDMTPDERARQRDKALLSLPSTVFRGYTFCIHTEDNERVATKARLLHFIKLHGGEAFPLPAATRTTHIIVAVDPDLRKDLVLPLIPSRRDDHTSSSTSTRWELPDIIRHLAYQAGPSGAKERGRKVVVRSDWLEACVRAGRILGAGSGYDGWEIRGTSDPRLENCPRSIVCDGKYDFYPHYFPRSPSPIARARRPVTPPRPSVSPTASSVLHNWDNHAGEGSYSSRHDGPSAIEQHDSAQSPSGPQALPRGPISSWSPTQTSNVTPPKVSQSIPQDPRIQAKLLLQAEQSETSKAPRMQFSTPPLSSTECFQSGFQPLTVTTSSCSTMNEFTGDMTVATPILSGDTPSTKTNSSSGNQQGVFMRDFLPISFYIEGDGASSRFVEIAITRVGAGFITTKDKAIIILLPLAKGEMATNPTHIRLIDELADDRSRAVLSTDWALHSIEKDELIPKAEYIVKKASAPANHSITSSPLALQELPSPAMAPPSPPLTMTSPIKREELLGKRSYPDAITRANSVERNKRPLLQSTRSDSMIEQKDAWKHSYFGSQLVLDETIDNYGKPLSILLERLSKWDQMSGAEGLKARLGVTDADIDSRSRSVGHLLDIIEKYSWKIESLLPGIRMDVIRAVLRIDRKGLK
ncbi:hypothetical protein CI109_104390 [Kwoniella shandongensis]|uniref:Uncharacterized protein n=1 Tax=Kwoniella shandongensis TaxID=1734106 RepID=A0A5M6BWX8_9TREE|nr:uncharacterized protein CI109_004211 [Kwoniella shandongensis]KAA5527398.1 hypothetical protein CI109_004211 [Kwoniella shandongensis]